MPPPPLRIGLGYDTHKLGNGGPLRLGGLDIESDVHAIGHSDADVLLHAMTDALLGAADLGDIGQLFPDTDPRNQGRDSSEFLEEAIRRVRKAGWDVVNLDSVVLAQHPKIAAYLEEMKNRIGEITNLSPAHIGIKGKTGEGVGAIGHAEAISARCVTLLYRTG